MNILTQADVIIFNGGDQSRHARTWLNDDGSCNSIFCNVIKRVRNNEVILMGTSAGTMIMSNPTYGEGSSFGHLYFENSYHLAEKKVTDGALDGTGLADVRNGT
jgi:cyanophycinase-like exopeptidase